MIDNAYPLRKAMDGGFRPSKEAREIEAALERMVRVRAVLQIVVRLNETLLRWFRMQGQ